MLETRVGQTFGAVCLRLLLVMLSFACACLRDCSQEFHARQSRHFIDAEQTKKCIRVSDARLTETAMCYQQNAFADSSVKRDTVLSFWGIHVC